jgi:hypothetical protein
MWSYAWVKISTRYSRGKKAELVVFDVPIHFGAAVAVWLGKLLECCFEHKGVGKSGIAHLCEGELYPKRTLVVVSCVSLARARCVPISIDYRVCTVSGFHM